MTLVIGITLVWMSVWVLTLRDHLRNLAEVRVTYGVALERQARFPKSSRRHAGVLVVGQDVRHEVYRSIKDAIFLGMGCCILARQFGWIDAAANSIIFGSCLVAVALLMRLDSAQDRTTRDEIKSVLLAGQRGGT